MARILTLYDRLPPEPDGGADFVARLGRELARLGHLNALLVPKDRGTERRFVPGSDLIETDFPWDDASPRAHQRALNKIRKWQPDVVHVVYPGKAPGGYRLPLAIPRNPSLRSLLTIFPVGLRGRSVTEWRSLVAALHGAGRVIVSAPEQRAWLSCLFPWLASKIDNIPSGGSVPDGTGPPIPRSAARARLGLIPDRIYLGHFGYLYRGKRTSDLIAACSSLDQAGIDFELLLIGGQGLEMQSGEMAAANTFIADLRDEIDRLELSSRVRTTRYLVPRLAETYIAACDAVIFPAKRFALGRSTAVAALACGVPLIVPNAYPKRYLRHVVDQENVLFYSPSARRGELAARLLTFCRDADLRERMRAAAGRSTRDWSWEELAARYEAALLAAAGKTGPADRRRRAS
jgi:glycosyltransferase involved in cell wall biosynthesis